MSDVNKLLAPLAVFSPIIAQKPEILVLKGSYLHNSYDVTITGNHLLLKVRNAWPFFMHSYIYDAAGTHLGTIRKERMERGWRYYAESPTGDKRRFELETVLDRKYLSLTKETLRFVNAISGQQEQVYLKNHVLEKHNAIMDNSTEIRVASVDREHSWTRVGYRLMIAPGADMVLIVGICMAIQNRFACYLPIRGVMAVQGALRECKA